VCKVLGGGLHDTKVITGMVVKRAAEGNVTSAEKCKVAVFACPLDIGRTETKGT
jgi:T-complex protein 1 subunit theta